MLFRSGFSPSGTPAPPVSERSALDRWALSEAHRTAREVDAALDQFDTQRAGRLLSGYIDDLSNWYVRRSRRRFWDPQGDVDPVEKDSAYRTLHHALVEADCIGSAAHVSMLARVPGRSGRRILSMRERNAIVSELVRILRTARRGRFEIRPTDQDVHLAVERVLTERLGARVRGIHDRHGIEYRYGEWRGMLEAVVSR